jgi:hypothetical protein
MSANSKSLNGFTKHLTKFGDSSKQAAAAEKPREPHPELLPNRNMGEAFGVSILQIQCKHVLSINNEQSPNK